MFWGSDKARATDYEKKAEHFHKEGDYEQALKHTELSLKFGARAYNNNPGYLAAKQFHLGVILRDMGRFDDALRAFDRALILARQSDESTGLQATMLFNSGVIHATLGQYHKAIEFYLQAEPLYFSEPQDLTGHIGNLQYGLADAYRRIGEMDRALDRVALAEAAYVKVWGEGNGGLARCYWLAADVHKFRGESQLAIDGYMRSFLNCLQHLEPGHEDINKLARELAILGEDPIAAARERFGEETASIIHFT